MRATSPEIVDSVTGAIKRQAGWIEKSTYYQGAPPSPPPPARGLYNAPSVNSSPGRLSAAARRVQRIAGSRRVALPRGKLGVKFRAGTTSVSVVSDESPMAGVLAAGDRV